MYNIRLCKCTLYAYRHTFMPPNINTVTVPLENIGFSKSLFHWLQKKQLVKLLCACKLVQCTLYTHMSFHNQSIFINVLVLSLTFMCHIFLPTHISKHTRYSRW